MTATLAELVARARTFTRDTSGAFIEDDDLVVWINEAYKDLASRLQVVQREEAWHITGATPADRQGLPLPTSSGNATYEVLSLRLGTVDVQFVNSELFNDWQDAGDVPPVTLGRIFNGQIELYPIPDELTEYTLRYAFVPADLVDAADEHMLPTQMERKLVEYAVASAKLKDGDDATSDRFFARYEQGLPQLATGRETLQPGPMSFQPAQSWFEEDARAHGSGRA